MDSIYATKNEVQRCISEAMELTRKQGMQITKMLLLFEPLVARIEKLEEELKCLKEPLQ